MIQTNLFYTKQHYWLKFEDEKVIIGITDYGQKALGEIVYLELPEEGSELQISQEFGIIESNKTVSGLIMPLSGKIIKINHELLATPFLINESPYEEGWIIIIKPSFEQEKEVLLDADAYKNFLDENEKS